MVDLEVLETGLMEVECSWVFAGFHNNLETVDDKVEEVRGATVKEEVSASVGNALVLLEKKLLKFLSGMSDGEGCAFEALDNGDREPLLLTPRTIEMALVPWVCWGSEILLLLKVWFSVGVVERVEVELEGVVEELD